MAKTKPEPTKKTEPTSADRVRESSERNAAEAAIQDKANRAERQR